jgi:NAD(P)-dependent dehydrogenase (short-subunit alcohol dehydrogenase family)
MAKSALIVGTGTGISASTARALAADGYKLTLAARRTDKLGDLARETKAHVVSADATRAEAVTALFDAAERANGPLDAVLYNASFRTRGPLIDLTPSDVEKTLMVSAFGGFLVGQEAARRMILRGAGVILFTGASASVKGYAQSAPFAMGKFALRGLAQSLARELQPQGIHVAHVVIDGAIDTAWIRENFPERAALKDEDGILNPEAIAENYWMLHSQPRSAWTHELDLRPWIERW